MTLPKSERSLLLLSLGASLFLVLVTPVFAQESYYWCYAQHPDLSYYDHPPMVAWLIWLGTAVFGDGRLGIRLGIWLCGAAGVLAGLGLLREFGASAAARRTWLVLGVAVPCLVVIRFFATPDPPLCAFWMLTLLALWKTRDGSLRWWVVAGFFAGCTLLSKYTAIFLAPGGIIVLLADPKMRRQLLRPGPWVGVAVAAVTFLPVVVWNVRNEFESFRFQTAGRWHEAELGLRWLGELLGGQLLMLNPIIACAVVASTWWLIRRRRKLGVQAIWLLAFGLPLIGFMLVNSLFVQVKMNWLIPAMQPLLLGLSMWWSDGRFQAKHPVAAPRWAKAAAAFSVLPLLAPMIVLVPQHRGSSWTGWDEIAPRAEYWEERVDKADGLEGNIFFFSGDYRDAAQLTRHLLLNARRADSGDVVETTMAHNVIGQKALQFDHWEDPRTRIGQDAIFVLPHPEMRQDLVGFVGEHFQSVKRVERVDVHRLGILVLRADIFVCRGYRGPKRLADR